MSPLFILHREAGEGDHEVVEGARTGFGASSRPLRPSGPPPPQAVEDGLS